MEGNPGSDSTGDMSSEKIILDNLSDPNDVSIVHNDGILYYVVYGWANIKKRIEIHVSRESAEAYILGVLIGSSDSCAITTLQHHSAPNTKSDLLVKTVLDKDAWFSYDGLIKIDKNAQKSNAYQRNENLILSENAHVDTRPELEIFANDVRCTHGATIGRLANEEVFYLRSRGLVEEEAVRLIVYGFVESVISRIPDEQMRADIIQWYEQHQIRVPNFASHNQR